MIVIMPPEMIELHFSHGNLCVFYFFPLTILGRLGPQQDVE